MVNQEKMKTTLYSGAKQYFPVRIIIFPLAMILTAFVTKGRTELGVMHYLFFGIILFWPFLSFLHVKSSRNSRNAEFRNLAVDLSIIGTCVTLSSFHPWVIVATLTVSSMGAMANGGIRLFLKSLLAYGIGVGIYIKFDRHMGQCQGMTHRHQVSCTLGSHNTGNARNAEDVAFPVLALLDQVQGFGLHYDAARRQGTPCGRLFVGDIDHMGFAGLVEMG